MDARSSLLAALSLALAACSSAPSKPSKQPGLTVFESVINSAANPDTIMRAGDRVSYLVISSGEHAALARFDASCSEPSASMYYLTSGGYMHAFSDDDSARLPDAQLQLLQRSEQRRAACDYRATPDWRALDTAENQDWLLLDRNSAKTENGRLMLWTARYPARYQMGAERALVAQRHERLAVDCTQRTFKRLSQFSTDANGAVLTGTLYGQATPLIAPQGQDDQRLLDLICKPAAEWAMLPKPPARTPLMPQLDTPVAPPAVLAAIDALQLPPPRLTLQAVDYRYDATVMAKHTVTDVHREDVFTHDPQSGQLLVQPNDAALGTELRLTFRGLIDLASRSFDRSTGEQVSDKSPVIGLDFKGDWKNLPQGSEVAYSLTQATGPKPHTSIVTCQVGAARAASQINAALQGSAKPLTCTKIKTKRMEWTQRFDYLEDYGVFVLAAENSPLGQWTWRVKSAR